MAVAQVRIDYQHSGCAIRPLQERQSCSERAYRPSTLQCVLESHTDARRSHPERRAAKLRARLAWRQAWNRS
jgi:hypothetical protein